MTTPRALRAFLLVSLCCSALCAGCEAVCRFALHWGEPYNTPTLRARLRFVDFHDFFPKFRYFHSRAFYDPVRGVLPYPAPTLVAYKIFLTPSPAQYHGAKAIAVYEGSLLLVLVVGVILLFRWLVRQGVAPGAAAGFAAATALCSFPFWFCFLQGNIEWIVWIFVVAGIGAWRSRRWSLAAVCLGIAVSMKIFPFVLLGLFVPQRRYRELGLALLTAWASTAFSLWMVCPDLVFSARQNLAALHLFARTYAAETRPAETGFDHSALALLKRLLESVHGPAEVRVGLYLLVAAVLGCVLFFVRIRRLPPANQVLCLSVAAVLLPPVSYDYTLLHLYPGLVMLLGLALEAERTAAPEPQPLPRGLFAALLTLGFLLSFQQEWIVHGVRLGGQLKCLALLWLGYLSLRFPFRSAALPKGLTATRRTSGFTHPERPPLIQSPVGYKTPRVRCLGVTASMRRHGKQVRRRAAGNG